MDRNNRKVRKGVVVSDKQDKTITVAVERRTQHPKYKRVVKKTKNYAAHDEENACNEGDTVEIMETRPISKTKKWRLTKIVEKAK